MVHCVQFFCAGVCERYHGHIANTQTMASRCANEAQVSGSEDLKELCSALEGEIAQAREAGFMVPIPKLTLVPREKAKKHKLQHTETERCETEFRISSSNKIQKQTDIDDGG